MLENREPLCTCDLCGVEIPIPRGNHPREVKRQIPGVLAWKPSPVHLAIAEGFNMIWPLDFCAPCWEDAWKRLDPDGKLRERLNAQLLENQKEQRTRSGGSV